MDAFSWNLFPCIYDLFLQHCSRYGRNVDHRILRVVRLYRSIHDHSASRLSSSMVGLIRKLTTKGNSQMGKLTID